MVKTAHQFHLPRRLVREHVCAGGKRGLVRTVRAGEQCRANARKRGGARKVKSVEEGRRYPRDIVQSVEHSLGENFGTFERERACDDIGVEAPRGSLPLPYAHTGTAPCQERFESAELFSRASKKREALAACFA